MNCFEPSLHRRREKRALIRKNGMNATSKFLTICIPPGVLDDIHELD